MRLRTSFSAALPMAAEEGLVASYVDGAALNLEFTVTGPEGLFAELKGEGRIEGRVVSVEQDGRDLLPTVLAVARKKEVRFAGTFLSEGPGPRDLMVTWAGLASLQLTLTPAEGFASLAASGILDVLPGPFAHMLDSVRVAGVAVKELEEIVEEEPEVPAPSPTPAPVPGPIPAPTTGFVRGIMLTDGLADTGLASARADEVAALRKAYDTVLVLADLQAPGGPHGTSPKLRPYAGFARDKGHLTALGLRNLRFWKQAGFRVHVILRNAWACKNGLSAYTPSLQRAGVKEADLFVDSELKVDQAFVNDLLAQAGDLVDGMMLVLEGTHPAAGPYSLKLLRHIRAKGFAGPVISNLIGDARAFQDELAAAGAWTASSINRPEEWDDSDQDIRNSDGMTALTSANPALIAQLVRNPGPRGFYLWAAEVVGGAGGRSDPLPAEFLGIPVSPPTPTPTPAPVPPVPDPVPPVETAEQRCKRLYPGVGFGGGNVVNGKPAPASHATIWKPKSDSTGRLVLVCGHELPRVRFARVMKNGVEVGRITKMRNIGNGWRLNLDGDKAGAAYGTGLKVVIATDGGDVALDVPNGGQRVEKRLPLPSQPSPGPVVPPPTVPVESLFVTTPNSLRLRDDFAAVVIKVDVLTAIHDPAVGPGPQAATVVPASRSGNTWTISASIESYPRGNVPNTWRIRLARGVPIPDGVTYHRSIMQSFVRVGDNAYGPGNKTYPPTIRT